MELGMRFASMAKEAKSAREAKTAFDMAVKAYGIVLNASSEEIKDFNMIFIGGLKGGENRADVWKDYQLYCVANNLIGLKKGELFEMMKGQGIYFHRSDGIYKVCFGKRLSPDLRNAQKQLLGSSVSQSEDEILLIES